MHTNEGIGLALWLPGPSISASERISDKHASSFQVDDWLWHEAPGGAELCECSARALSIEQGQSGEHRAHTHALHRYSKSLGAPVAIHIPYIWHGWHPRCNFLFSIVWGTQCLNFLNCMGHSMSFSQFSQLYGAHNVLERQTRSDQTCTGHGFDPR